MCPHRLPSHLLKGDLPFQLSFLGFPTPHFQGLVTLAALCLSLGEGLAHIFFQFCS